jgi:methionine-rich copper-binding protein CopC
VTSRLGGALIGAGLLAWSAIAPAHSLLLAAAPAAGSRVRAPARVTLRFNNRIEKRLSRVALVDAQDVRHDLPVVVTEGAANTLSALPPPLAPGAYRIDWQVLSADGHVVSGRYRFQVTP